MMMMMMFDDDEDAAFLGKSTYLHKMVAGAAQAADQPAETETETVTWSLGKNYRHKLRQSWGKAGGNGNLERGNTL